MGGSKDETLEEPARASDPPGDEAAAERAPSAWRYEILHEHARGGLGRVLVARDHQLGRIVALKELITTGGPGEARFAREARLTARLEHPSVVPVHDAGVRPGAGTPFYAMKLVSGRPLDEAVAAAGSFAERLALVPRVLDVAEAVAYAHSVGIVHRDLKPANVLLGAYGETVVIDWGLAKEKRAAETPGDAAGGGGDAQLTVAGAVLGTPAFMAPEQARGEDVDERADVWALGALLYHVLAGAPPYRGASSAEIIAQVAAAPPAPLASRAPEVPDDLAALVGKAMARAPGERYANAGALADDLARFLSGRLVAAHRYTTLDRLVRLMRRHRALAVATVVFAVLALAGGAAFVVREQRLRREAEDARAAADVARAAADRERGRAERMSAGLLEQQARAELTAGRPRRAGPLVAELIARGGDRLVVRHLAAQVNAALATRLGALVGHERDVTAVVYADGGRLAITGGYDGAWVWDVASGKRLRQLAGVPRRSESLALHPDGRHVAVGDHDQRRIVIHELATGQVVRVEDDPDSYRMAYAPDGSLWVGGMDGSLRVYDPAGARVHDGRPHTERLQALAIAPAGDRVATGGYDGVLVLWDARTRRPLARLDDHGTMIGAAVFSPDGRHLVTSDARGAIRVRDAATGRVLVGLDASVGPPWSLLRVTPDGQRLITASADGVLRVWHLASGALLGAVDVEARGRVIALALAPAGDEVLVAGPGGAVGRWSLPGGVRVMAPAVPGRDEGFGSATWAEEGRLVVAPLELGHEQPGGIDVRRAADGALVRSLRFPLDPHNSVADPRALRVAVAGENIPTGADTGVFDLEGGARLGSFALHERRVYDAAASPDGAWFLTAGRDGTVRRWDAATGAAIGEPWRFPGRVSAVAVSPDGARVAVAVEDGAISILDATSGAVLERFAAHPSWVQKLAFDGTGTRLLSCGRQDRTGKIWALPGGAPVATLVGHADNLFHGSLSRDGRVAATVSVEGEARLWDASTGELLRVFRGPTYAASLSPDDGELLVAGKRGYLAVIDVRAEVPADFAARVAAGSPWRLIDGRLEPAW